jgi:hypothetical protein
LGSKTLSEIVAARDPRQEVLVCLPTRQKLSIRTIFPTVSDGTFSALGGSSSCL